MTQQFEAVQKFSKDSFPLLSSFALFFGFLFTIFAFLHSPAPF